MNHFNRISLNFGPKPNSIKTHSSIPYQNYPLWTFSRFQDFTWFNMRISRSSNFLTPKLAEWRFYVIGFSSVYCAKFYLPKLFESKFSYPFLRLLQLLYFADFTRKTVGPRKKIISGVKPQFRELQKQKLKNGVDAPFRKPNYVSIPKA